MDPKPRPNHRLYLETLRSMTPEQRLLKAFELSEFSKALFTGGLRQRFPDATEEEFRQILLDRLEEMSRQERWIAMAGRVDSGSNRSGSGCLPRRRRCEAPDTLRGGSPCQGPSAS
jgi:hypothetical protein